MLYSDNSHFISAGGNNDFKEFYSDCYLFDFLRPERPIKLPSLPVALSHSTLIDFHMSAVYLIGGIKSNGQPPIDEGKTEGMTADELVDHKFKCDYQGEVVKTVYKLERHAEQWVEVCQLRKPRCDLEALMIGEKIFIYAGYNGFVKGRALCTTEIEIFDIESGTTSAAEYRLPLGVCGTSVTWHGEDILMIGGKRQGQKSTAVMKLDFVNKTILSLRDLSEDRSNSITIPIKFDEVLVLGGAGAGSKKTAEKRTWNSHIQDYKFTNIGTISGSEHVEHPDEYSNVTKTFCINALDDDNFPAYDLNSNFLFGNEEMPFLMEITGDMKIEFYPAPLRLQ